MKIISWNVNGLRANIKKGGFDWFINENPDIYCLQETKARPEQLPEGIIKSIEYSAFFDFPKEKKGYSGVAIFVKSTLAKKILKVENGLGNEKYDKEGRFLAIHFKDFLLINCYFPNGGGGPERLKFKLEYYQEFLKYLKKNRKKYHKIVFCGDVNTAHQEIDLARPKENEKNTGFLPEERAWIDELMTNGYTDTFRYFNPDKISAYTYWDMKTFARERNVGWRIDYFFVSKEFLPKIKKASILKDIHGSDHCPIALEIDY